MTSPHRFAALLFALLASLVLPALADYPAGTGGSSLATSGGNQALFHKAPTSAEGDAYIRKGLETPFKGDANDVLFQWESSYDYDPSPGLDRVEATVLAINGADDERNPPELRIMEREIQRVKNGRYLLVPGGPDTAGHGTTGMARLYKAEVAKLLAEAPRR
jgi:homoserine O-acetyltransferase/O-succinyltransferase